MFAGCRWMLAYPAASARRGPLGLRARSARSPGARSLSVMHLSVMHLSVIHRHQPATLGSGAAGRAATRVDGEDRRCRGAWPRRALPEPAGMGLARARGARDLPPSPY
jgi:hypothetical protein